MKILLYVSSYLPGVGGREVVLHQLAKSYQKLGHEVRVAGPGSWRRCRHYNFGYKVYRLPRIPFIPNEWILMAQLVILKMIYKFDIVHAHSTFPNGFAAARVKKMLNCPLVITPHGEDIHKVPEIGFGDRLNPVLDRKISYAMQKAEYITSISNSVTKSIEDAGVAQEKIIAIANGVDLDRFGRQVDVDIYAMMKIPRDAQIILSIGNYHPRKGHEVLIESIAKAVKQNNHIRLVLVGKTSDALMQQVVDQGLDQYIHFAGILPYPVAEISNEPDTLVALMNAAEIYVTASIGEGTEGLSLALLEAMSAGLCVIGTDISGNRDIIENGENGVIVPPSSSDDLSQAIVDVLNDDEKRQLFKQKAQALVQQYGWLEIAKEYVALYEKCLAEY